MSPASKDHLLIVLGVWNGTLRRDCRFETALHALGMTTVEFDRLRREARRTERHFPHRLVLTPTSLGRRR